jgi:hypothetical protein
MVKYKNIPKSEALKSGLAWGETQNHKKTK